MHWKESDAMQIDLPVIWAGIIGFGVFLYVMLDGFDLGIGLLFPFFESKADRQVMMNTVAPVWDGNETFLVLGGAGLYCAFPVVYSTLLPANYLPLILMVVGLIFRGAAFELRAKARRTQNLWDLAFVCGSALAAFCQGIVLGSLLQGIKVADGRFVGGPFDWLSPFSLFCGFGVMFTYAMLGCGWLIMKTEGRLQHEMRLLMRPLTAILLVIIGVVSLWTVIGLPAVAHRWFGSGYLGWFVPVPVLVVACVWGIFRTARHADYHATPFLLALALVFLGYTGLVISIWPNILPPSLTIWQASSSHSSQVFGLVGTAIVLPIILVYNAMQYRVFRGKVREGDAGYHH
jgi:cytochrome d ubiquinol oxidase subunit II